MRLWELLDQLDDRTVRAQVENTRGGVIQSCGGRLTPLGDVQAMILQGRDRLAGGAR